ncbi:ATP synthase F1 subunit gamma [Saccharicrinis fermentans]|uniref:ATP synthase gamma chain n=1 Tax=Saccharicrinis fermentans DSM 9555 = JCM 21142 TaxID=869213 RepID=W7YIQ3_9BACT|nr:ATP synthase F1 subunit gamma [Saccharicrinis fermentans]GAF02419.1 F-ATPase gamma subunit [Saccharicrinis fermentans DSM 9555 = JCM 21142]
MASLKDIRTRIDSVKTTRQVTSAMKLVSAAKLKKAQDNIVRMRPYADKLNEIIYDLINSVEDDSIEIDLADVRETKRVLVVMITSNRGLCGAFNSNVVKEVTKLIKEEYASLFKNASLDVLAIGKQGEKLLKSAGILCVDEKNDIYNHLSYSAVEDISNRIFDDFRKKKYDRVFVAYNEFVNAAVQNATIQQFLPLQLPEKDPRHASVYLYEPDEKTIVSELIPKALKTIFFKTVLDSVAAEHGARMTSMHKATDNASDLISELQLSYNKARQSSITNEILEIVSGAEALRK